jgi:hypothetical protein
MVKEFTKIRTLIERLNHGSDEGLDEGLTKELEGHSAGADS